MNIADKTILAVSPHPDDAEYSCGGLLYMSNDAHNAIITSDALRCKLHGIGEVEKPALQAGRILNCDVILMRTTNEDQPEMQSRKIITQLDIILAKIKPDIFLIPYYEDTNQEHVLVSRCCMAAVRASEHLNVLFYRGASSINFEPNVFAKLTPEAFDAKCSAVECYTTETRITKFKRNAMIHDHLDFGRHLTENAYYEFYKSYRFFL